MISSSVDPRHICPYLGSTSDAETPFAYSTWENHCYRSIPHQPVERTHQAHVCLTGSHVHCPVFISEVEWQGWLPEGIRARPDQLATPNRRWIVVAIGFAIPLLLGLGLLLIIGSAPADLPPETQYQPEIQASPYPSTGSVTAGIPSPLPDSSATPQVSPTPTTGLSATPIPPSATDAAPTPSPTLDAYSGIALLDDTNLRDGPGTEFALLQILPEGTRVQLLARNVYSYWIMVRTDDGAGGWIAVTHLPDAVDVELLPVVYPTPTPEAAAPTLQPVARTALASIAPPYRAGYLRQGLV